jgi:hypothetical protein
MKTNAQALGEAVLRTLGKPFCKLVFGSAQARNHLEILATMPQTLWSIRREYERVADAAYAEPEGSLADGIDRALEIF